MSLKKTQIKEIVKWKTQRSLKYHCTWKIYCFTAYKKLLTHKRNEYYNNKLSELEDITYNLDAKKFWNCLKSIDDSIKYKATPPLNCNRELDELFPVSTF